jgi:hypothetical protein
VGFPLSKALAFEIHLSCISLHEKGISPLASGDKGSAPLTAPPFEKGGRKLLRIGLCELPDKSQFDFIKATHIITDFIRLRQEYLMT